MGSWYYFSQGHVNLSQFFFLMPFKKKSSFCCSICPLLVGPAIVIHAEVLVDSQGPEIICLPLYLKKGLLGMIEEQLFIDKLP